MAYAAAISVKQTIERILNSCHVSVPPATSELMESVLETVTFLQKNFASEDSNSETMMSAWESEILESASRIEDLLESLVSSKFLSESEALDGDDGEISVNPLTLSQDLAWELEEEIELLDHTVENIKNLLRLEENESTKLKDWLTGESRKLEIVSILGPAGVGKSTLAKQVYEDPVIVSHFDHRAFVSIGLKGVRRQILLGILRQLNPWMVDKSHAEIDETSAEQRVYRELRRGRYLIVLDDVWTRQVWDDLRRFFPDKVSGSRIVVTTRLRKVADYISPDAGKFLHKKRRLNEADSWKLLREMVFGRGETCPPKLQEPGKKIARKCEGLPLKIRVIADLLHNEMMTTEYWEKVAEKMDSFTAEDYDIQDLHQSTMMLDEDDATVWSRTDDLPRKKSKMVGLDDEIHEIMNLLIRRGSSERKIVSLVGMAGIGKTTLSREVYEHPLVLSQFDFRVWLTVGPKFSFDEIMLDILAKLNFDIARIYGYGQEVLGNYIKKSLQGRKYFMVLDDIWNTQVWHELKKFIPDNRNGSVIMLTTRLLEVAKNANSYAVHSKRFLNRKESWHLLCEKVFDKEFCPSQLEEAGKKIAENCEGLPLAIIAISKHLSKAERTPEYWTKVAEKESSTIIGEDAEVSKVLYLSYQYLPHHLKACFLYTGVFPRDYVIPASRLIKLWCSEGFLEPNLTKHLEDFSMECLQDLVSRSVVLPRQQSSTNKIKTCKVHSVFLHLCIREAEKIQFFHVINSKDNQDIESQRRICVQNNVLFGIKDIRESMESVENARSLLCTGPHHQHPVPICLGFNLLRVLDALTIRFYMFPTEVTKLVQLRYVAITYDGKLPSSISKLRNLQYLIVREHLSILSRGARRSYLPMEIWTMQELRHLQVMGSDLPDPDSESALLPNLSALVGVSAHSCTKRVLRSMPNLKKLGIQIELPVDATETLCFFDHLAHLSPLESFKCCVVNPNLKVQFIDLHKVISMFPIGLKKLSLSGLGLPWEYMSIIARLPNLQVLKLRCYAFRGPVWEIYEVGFCQLRFLLLEDTDMECWNAGCNCFPMLQHLIIQHCYKLKEMPSGFGDIPTLEMIELLDCDPCLVASSKQILEKQKSSGNDSLQIRVESSEDDRKPKS
ncbi:UNVERIFIED_CONTAM: putative disease resistance protein [Sesamum radiatum]|uniref:Disease resistance protein n=1 Tax=Sesamum radiatum TaxID=300843 RepID=A0AAW2UBZ1_SESRA